MDTEYNNIIIDQTVSLPYPFGVHKAFPLDSRSFFTNLEDALEAVHDAVQLTRVGESMFMLPSEENGGADSVYYYGQPIAVSSGDGFTADLYLVVKTIDRDGGEYGTLKNVCYGLDENYLRKDEVEEYLNEIVESYVKERLNTECITDYLFTNAVDDCGHTIPSTGLYSFGIKEVEGLIQLCNEAKKVLSFDPDIPYDKNTNPLATLQSVSTRIQSLKTELDKTLACIKKQLKNKVDKKRGYGLSQNDFTDCLLEKLLSIPEISLDGDKFTINGKSFKLEEWVEIFDYYIGWMNLDRREDFLTVSKDELVKSVKDTGYVPPEGKLYGPKTACGYNTFFFMKQKRLNIDSSVKGKYSEWVSEELPSPIRTYIPSVIHHNDVMINDTMYDVYGLHTYYPNSADTVQIAFNLTLFDYYVGWMKLESRNDFYSKTKDELISHAQFGNFDSVYHVYDREYLNDNLFYLMVKDTVEFDVPVEIDGETDHSKFMSFFDNGGELYGLESPIAARISSVMEHDTIDIDGVTYRVYGVHTYRPNSTDSVHIVFSK